MFTYWLELGQLIQLIQCMDTLELLPWNFHVTLKYKFEFEVEIKAFFIAFKRVRFTMSNSVRKPWLYVIFKFLNVPPLNISIKLQNVEKTFCICDVQKIT